MDKELINKLNELRESIHWKCIVYSNKMKFRKIQRELVKKPIYK